MDNFSKLSFKDFLTVDYTPGMPELISYRAKKRKTGMVGEAKMEDDPCWNGYKMVGKKKKNGKEVPNCVPEETDLEQVEEALSLQQRRKKSIMFKRLAPRIQLKKKIRMKRAADLPRLKTRARKQARKMLFNKLSKNTPKDELSYARRQEIEKRLDKMKGRIDKIALRLLPKVRKQDIQRRTPKSDDDGK